MKIFLENTMKFIIFSFLSFFFVFIINSAELKVESYGKEDLFMYDVSESRKYFVWNGDAVWKTNIGINGSSKGKGILEVINGKTSSNLMTKWTETNGDYFYAQFFNRSGTVNDANIQTFEIVSGTGRWLEIVGQKCIGAYIAFIDSKFMWQGKCEMSNKTLERLQTYKISE